MKSYLNLIKYALQDNCLLSVWDCEEGGYLIKNSQSYKAVKDEIESMDFTNLVIRQSNGDYIGTASIILSNEDEEISDYTICDYLESWANKHYFN